MRAVAHVQQQVQDRGKSGIASHVTYDSTKRRMVHEMYLRAADFNSVFPSDEQPYNLDIFIICEASIHGPNPSCRLA